MKYPKPSLKDKLHQQYMDAQAELEAIAKEKKRAAKINQDKH